VDNELLSRIREGDREAFTGLVNETWNDLVEHLTWMLGSRHAAEDAGQETFVRVWEHRERWRRGSPRALVFRIGRNLAIDEKRKEQVRRVWAAGEAETPPCMDGPDDDAETSEWEDNLRKALDALPPDRREIVELVRLRGLSHREVAETLGISPQTVANRMTLALADLRILLADLLPGLRATHSPTRGRESSDG